ncbi:hypothetical protein [Marinococcus halotolerans]|uniref:hypothetical protein n=1 Tax=Marinococcus halotolerans TaxID=301092 RepID=UPI0003B73C0F|nr:hypothetical protein [Marinococcus halotolerans]
MTESTHPFMVVILDPDGREVNAFTEEVQEANDHTPASVSFSTYEQAQAFYDQCKLKFPDCSIKILPQTI